MSLRPRVRYSHYRGHRITDGPSLEPVSVADMKDQLSMGEDDANTNLISMYITAAREHAEQYMGRALITQKWQLALDHWPSGREPWWDGVRQGAISELRSSGREKWIVLPRHPLQSVDEMRVYDDSGNDETVDLSDFIVDTHQEPGRLVLRSNATWPVALQSANAIEVDYTAGYGDDPKSVPMGIRVAIMQMSASLYEHRGDQCSIQDAMRISGAQSALDRYRVRSI